jgi:hypothetical protein
VNIAAAGPHLDSHVAGRLHGSRFPTMSACTFGSQHGPGDPAEGNANSRKIQRLLHHARASLQWINGWSRGWRLRPASIRGSQDKTLGKPARLFRICRVSAAKPAAALRSAALIPQDGKPARRCPSWCRRQTRTVSSSRVFVYWRSQCRWRLTRAGTSEQDSRRTNEVVSTSSYIPFAATAAQRQQTEIRAHRSLNVIPARSPT